jgi:hypothetical protein
VGATLFSVDHSCGKTGQLATLLCFMAESHRSVNKPSRDARNTSLNNGLALTPLPHDDLFGFYFQIIP